jgi:hypothetical protein
MRNTSRGRAQDRARVAGGQDPEVRYEADKSGARSRRSRRPSKKSATAARRSKLAWKNRDEFTFQELVADERRD